MHWQTIVKSIITMINMIIHFIDNNCSANIWYVTWEIPKQRICLNSYSLRTFYEDKWQMLWQPAARFPQMTRLFFRPT